jgi:rhodanese-related sulfurtransferase
MRKWLLGAVAVTLFLTSAAGQTDKSLTPSEFEKQIKVKDVQILDVRTAGEFYSGHVPQALQADWNQPEQFRDRIKYLSKEKPIYIYCLSGGRSAQAAEYLRSNGYPTVWELRGGIRAWRSAGKHLESQAPVAEITLPEYLSLLSGHSLVLVDFGAQWCPPCKQMEPVVDRLARDLGPSLFILHIDAGTQGALMKQLQLDALPSFVIYHDGREHWRGQGITPLTEFKKQLPPSKPAPHS